MHSCMRVMHISYSIFLYDQLKERKLIHIYKNLINIGLKRSKKWNMSIIIDVKPTNWDRLRSL